MARLFVDHEGELRGMRVMAVVAAAMLAIAFATAMAMMFGTVFGETAVAGWTLAAFLLIKLPLLLFIWWILGRKRHESTSGDWSSRECHEILTYLEREAQAGMRRPDRQQRLAYFCREAWFVAHNAAPRDADSARETAERIEALAAEAGVDTAPLRTSIPTTGVDA